MIDPLFLAVAVGLAAGTLARAELLRIDYRQYPTYPHAAFSHLTLGFIAAFLGAVAVPALAEKEFTAVTFLALAAQQFREIRTAERESLENLEANELVSRGLDYIEGIAKVFEARNYVVMLVALAGSSVTLFVRKQLGPDGLGPLLASTAAGALSGWGAYRLAIRRQREQVIGDVACVSPAPVSFKGPDLFVGDVHIMNVGLEEAREYITKFALGLILEPRNAAAREILADRGQRQAILHDAAAAVGIRKDVSTPEFTPLIRRDLETGKVGLYLVPDEKDEEALIRAVRRVPVLESARGAARSALGANGEYHRHRQPRERRQNGEGGG